MKRLPIFFACVIVLISTSGIYAQKQAPASGKILAPAYAKAAKEKKNVFLLFHASWCVWCHKMDSSMNDPACKSFFENNYVVAHLDLDEEKNKKYLENNGADLVRKRFHGEAAGLPFWVILDKNGKVLGDSYIRKEGQTFEQVGESIGCPAEDHEVAAFIETLKKTSKLNDEQLAIIAERFRKNK